MAFVKGDDFIITLEKALQGIKPLHETTIQLAKERQHSLVKPAGSLGRLEDISIQIAGITGKVKNTVEHKILFLFGADNGVCSEGIAGSPQSFTNHLMNLYGSGANCAINVICKQNNVTLQLVDVGIIGEIDGTAVINKRLMEGTHNLYQEAAMTREIAYKAMEIGFSYAALALEQGYNIIGTGEVGIGNTTTAAACIMAALGTNDCEKAVGRGAGLTEEAFANKKRVIEHALSLHHPNPLDSIDIVSKVGGFDIAALVGLYIGAAYYRIPIVIDGVISMAAALLAFIQEPLTKEYMIPSHCSKEPAYLMAANHMELEPILNLDMRLGEGTGCPIAMGVVENAVAVMNQMSTFEEVALNTAYRKVLKMN